MCFDFLNYGRSFAEDASSEVNVTKITPLELKKNVMQNSFFKIKKKLE